MSIIPSSSFGSFFASSTPSMLDRPALNLAQMSAKEKVVKIGLPVLFLLAAGGLAAATAFTSILPSSLSVLSAIAILGAPVGYVAAVGVGLAAAGVLGYQLFKKPASVDPFDDMDDLSDDENVVQSTSENDELAEDLMKFVNRGKVTVSDFFGDDSEGI